MHGDIVQWILDDPKIPRSLVGVAWERARNHFNPQKIDNLQSGHQMSPPTSNSSHSHHKSTALDLNKDPNLNKLTLTWLWTM